MTTQHTHHEHSDVDASVVEHPFASEVVTDPTQTATSTETVGQMDIPSAEHATPTAEVEEQNATNATPLQAEELPAAPGGEDGGQAPQDIPEAIAFVAPADAEHVLTESASDTEPGATSSTSAHSEMIPLVVVEEEVRPFTEFIKEFHQAEARLNASLQELPAEAFTLLTPDDTTAPAEQASSEAVLTPVENMSQPLSVAPSEEESQITTTINNQNMAETVDQDTEGPLSPVAPSPTERPVSPLLRPASRLRLPRHGGIRHREEPTTPTIPPAAGTPSMEEPAAESPVETQGQLSPTEIVAEPEQARPARRYRFDRPATANGAVQGTQAAPAQTAFQQRVEESKDVLNRASSTPPFTRTENEESTNLPGTQTKPVASVTPSIDQQPALQEPLTLESIGLVTPSATEQGRRRPTQERSREKEQSSVATPPSVTPVAPAIDVVVPGVEPAAKQPEEIAPEDLPPLEYSELQKATSRRRRRHRSGPANAAPAVAPANVPAVSTPSLAVKPVSPAPIVESPTEQAAAPTQAPRTTSSPTTPPSPVIPNQYTIVSGYTVNQMNQGNEVTGPFMGPEPSPARGSITTRDGRTTRAEGQRSPIYPVRTNDNTISAASINQLASVVSQAIQGQTDRMVAELRRANQVPTSVSVSLPPFPSTERVGVFVDVANLLYSARTLRIAVDFGKLLDFLRGNRRLVRAQAYCPTSPQAGDEQMFLQAVKGLGYRITTKNYKTFSSGAKKADLDLDLCMDVVRLVDGKAVDCIVLVSGDSDFMPMLDYCSDHGVRVEVAAFDEAMSATLRQSCDLFINLSMLEEIRA